jgi:hypothetical protein
MPYIVAFAGPSEQPTTFEKRGAGLLALTWTKDFGYIPLSSVRIHPSLVRERHLRLEVTRTLTVNKATDAQENPSLRIERQEL